MAHTEYAKVEPTISNSDGRLFLTPIKTIPIIAINMLMAFITPPVGLGLFVVQGLAPDVPITTIIRGALPFVICEAIAIILVVVYPPLAMWLPSLLF